MSNKNKSDNKKFEEKEIKIEEQAPSDEATTSADEAPDTKEQADETDDLTKKLEEAQEKIAELQDKYLRQVAEFDNYRKRVLKEKSELILNGGEKVISSLLPVLDDFDRAISNIKKDKTENPLLQGVELIYQKFNKTLESQGLKKIEADKVDFNTDLHEAIAMIPAESDEMKGKVIDCVQAGYTLNDKVIRHAKVAVGQ